MFLICHFVYVMCGVKVPKSQFKIHRITNNIKTPSYYGGTVLDINYNLRLLFKQFLFDISLCLRYVYSEKRSEFTKQFESNKVQNTVFYIQKTKYTGNTRKSF